MGGRGSGSRMASSAGPAGSSSGNNFMSNRQNMEDYAIATGALDMGSEEDTRAFLRTPEGREALRDFMDGEREAGLTESEMRQAIQDTGSSRESSTTTPGLVNDSDGLRRQVQNARQNGYKSPQVNDMVRQGQAAGWKETYPGYDQNTGTAYRSMATNGTGALSNRTAKVTVTDKSVNLLVSDGNVGGEYRFSNVSDAIQSGNRFVSNRRASSRRGGPKDNEFLVGSGRAR